MRKNNNREQQQKERKHKDAAIDNKTETTKLYITQKRRGCEVKKEQDNGE